MSSQQLEGEFQLEALLISHVVPAPTHFLTVHWQKVRDKKQHIVVKSTFLNIR